MNSPVVNATSTTIAGNKVRINAPARRDQRVYVLAVSATSDATNGIAGLQDGTDYTIASVTTNTSTTVTSAALYGAVGSGPVWIGQMVTGTGVPADTFVSAKASSSSITISQAATATGSPDLTFSGETRFHVQVEPRAAAVNINPFTPAEPIPVSDTGKQAWFSMDGFTTARLSVSYLYRQ